MGATIALLFIFKKFPLGAMELSMRLGQESYPINTEAGATICLETTLVRLLVFTTKNFTIGFSAPA